VGANFGGHELANSVADEQLVVGEREVHRDREFSVIS
jgi:hypothetical protein